MLLASFSSLPARAAHQAGYRAPFRSRSQDAADVANLDEFLFGPTRASLQRVRAPLLEAQGGWCFYCGMPARASVEMSTTHARER